jgi:ABC-type dipeptide/oligopeptide/nickel transport system ATPase component
VHAYAGLIDELPRILETVRATTLLVTHSAEEAMRLADDLVVLVGGRVHAAGDKREIAANPRAVEVAQALGHTILSGPERTLAVPSGALKMGGGPIQFSMRVDAVVDAVAFKEIVGRIGGVHARVRLEGDGGIPSIGDDVTVHPESAFDLR